MSRESGFTLLEMIIVMFVLVALLGIVIPRFDLGEDLASTGRKMIGSLRSLQSLAMSIQKPIKLSFDLDQGSYWAVMIDGKEEKPLLDATWALPRKVPEDIRITDALAGAVKKQSGRIDVMLYPNGRIDPTVLHLADAGNRILGIAVDPTTGAIKTSDERIEQQRILAIPDRVKPLLVPTTTVAANTTSPLLKP